MFNCETLSQTRTPQRSLYTIKLQFGSYEVQNMLIDYLTTVQGDRLFKPLNNSTEDEHNKYCGLLFKIVPIIYFNGINLVSN